MEECKYQNTPHWKLIRSSTSEIKQKFIQESYFPKSDYSKYFIFIASKHYDTCCEKLLSSNSVVKFNEVFGRYDFIAKAYFKQESEIDLFNEILLSDNTVHSEKNIIFNKVKAQYEYVNGNFKKLNNNRVCEEYDTDELHIINAFVELKKMKYSKTNREDLLKSMPRVLQDKDLSKEIIYKVYFINDDSILFFLNIDCKNIRKLNTFTTAIDQLVDKKKYLKTTYISTKDHINDSNSENIINLFKQHDKPVEKENKTLN